YEEPVVIQGDRLEPAYEELEGQWGGIRIFQSSKGSFINNAIIKNSLVGVYVDSAAELTIKNTIVKNTSGSGIIGYHSKIQADNLLIYNNGGSCFQGSYGGNYSFAYSTFGSYVNQNEAIAVNNKKCLDLASDFSCSVLVAVNPLNISLTNCIIAGASNDEILLDDFTGDKNKSDFTYTLKNCIVKVADLLKSDQYPNFFENCEGCYNLKQNDKLFLNQPLDDYKLDTLSVALDKALYLPAFPKDIIGKDRNNQSPDIGCFEL
nr:right-handed parallel beta-helix repeat-containing protein [Saprospiraceae bacterium]